MSHIHTALGSSLVAYAAAFSFAQPVLITAPQTIAPNQSTIVPTAGGAPVNLATAQLTIRGTTLTINGRHSVASLLVQPNGATPAAITHAANFSFDYSGGAGTDIVRGTSLIVSGAATFEANTSFSGLGLGYPSQTGPGAGSGSLTSELAAGGGHGGNGGTGAPGFNPTSGGVPSDSYSLPVDFGSGGGRDNSALGGAGGGSLAISATGTITILGLLTTQGSASAGAEAGGGAGGSIFLSAPSILGSGSLIANGGNANLMYAGGGGGGRIALVATNPISATLTIAAIGGRAWMSGAAGSIYTKIDALPSTTIFDNGNLIGQQQRTTLTSQRTFDHLIVKGRAYLSHLQGESGFTVTVNNTAIFEANSGIDVSARGFLGTSGPGTGGGGPAFDVATGGGHGGNGGDGHPGFPVGPGGSTYGSISAPVTFGSAGGADNTATGGSGGGGLRLSVAGALSHAGVIRADGAASNGAESGGGAGGSIWITADSFAGSGTVSANGGSANLIYAGGGGGGRIALFTSSAHSPSLSFLSTGGSGYMRGSAGSIHTKVDAQPGTTTYDNGDINTLQNRTNLATDRTFDHLVVRGRALLSHLPAEPGFTITVNNSATFEINSGIDVSGRGFPSTSGPGAGSGGPALDVGSGGGHGGNGGDGLPDFPVGPGGATYGSISTPTTFGSGGGADNTSTGGSGGGALRLSVVGALSVSGVIRADGANSGGFEAGGGAGGSIWITADSFAGSGSVTANGGSANIFYSGAGGGGRIAIFTSSAHSPSLSLLSTGGSGYMRGSAGSIHTKVDAQPSTTTYDNGNINTLQNRTNLATDRTFDNLIIKGRASLSHAALEESVQLTVNNDLTVEQNSSINLSGRGFPSDTGPGAGTGSSANDVGGGGSYGGRGGAGSPGFGSPPSGPTYGSRSAPTEFGSGGGRDNVALGGAGGGAAKILVTGTAIINGLVACDGASIIVNEPGAGSGGSLWFAAATLTGSGTITANGGNASIFYSGGGGGGRIALFSCNVLMPAANIRALGGSGNRPGAPGTIYNGSSSIIITEQPVGGTYVGNDFFQLGANGTGNGPISFQWRRRDSSGEFVNLTEGENGLFGGVDTSTLFVSGATCLGGGTFDCLICDSCGCVPTVAATIIVNSTGDFNADGGVDGADVEAFFEAWVAADAGADVNNDGGVDGADVEFFFINWTAGC